MHREAKQAGSQYWTAFTGHLTIQKLVFLLKKSSLNALVYAMNIQLHNL